MSKDGNECVIYWFVRVVGNDSEAMPALEVMKQVHYTARRLRYKGLRRSRGVLNTVIVYERPKPIRNLRLQLMSTSVNVRVNENAED